MPDLLEEFKKMPLGKKASFAEFFMERYLRSDFGVLTKREIELILVQAVKEHGLFNGMSNYEISAFLGMNDRRLKGLLLDASIKYDHDTLRTSINRIIDSLVISGKEKFDYENGYITFSLEDPVVRRDFDNALKKLGYYSDSSFRSDIVRVRDSSFLAFLYHHHNYTYRDFMDRLKKANADQKDLRKVITDSRSWKERFDDSFKALKEGKEKIDFIKAALQLLKSILL